MKRIFSLLLSCSMLMVSFSTYAESLAANQITESINETAVINAKGPVVSSDDYTDSNVDGKSIKLKNVGVNFNDTPLKTSFPSVLYESRTMVPLRDIAEATGADVEWDPVNLGITIKSSNKTIYLEIDSQDVLINGIKKSIDYGVAPKLISRIGESYSYTMVPLRFISEEIGCKVDWDESAISANITYPQLGSSLSKTELSDITAVDLNTDQLSSISISLASASSPKVYTPSEDPNKIILDIPNSKIKINGSERKYFESHISKFPVQSVSASQIDSNNVRVTVNLDTSTSFDAVFDGNNIRIDFPKISTNSLKDVTYEVIGGREAILLHNTSSKDYRAFKLSGTPGRIVLDLKDTLLNTSDKSINSSTVSGIRMSQYENSAEYEDGSLVTRVVLDLNSKLADFSYSVERIDNNIAVFVKDETVSKPVTPPSPPSPPSGNGSGSNPVVPDSGESVTYTQYNMTIDEMVKAQSSKLTVTDKYRNDYAYIHESHVETINGIIGTVQENNTPVRAQTDGMSFIYGHYNRGALVTILNKSNGWYGIKYNTWRNAKPEDIRYYLNPDNFGLNTSGAFQFLDLSKPSGISASELDGKVLVNKGVLSGKGNSFIEAGKKYGVNEIYLVSHAFLETGNGSSKLASGVLVSTVDGKPVEPKTVYNMFGIGATDANALKFGSERAYKEGWFSPEEAIVGGAKFISEKYIASGQNTLYEMRWNPDINKVWHQYATDIGWAYKQVNNMKKLYDLCSGYTLKYDIPVYKK